MLAALENPRRKVLRLVLGEEADGAVGRALDARRDRPAVERLRRPDLAALLPAGAVHQGFAALVAPLPEPSLPTVLAGLPASAAILALDQVTDPHNVGAILRSAEAFGAAAVLVTERHAPHETATLAKSASGALERVPLLRVPNLARGLGQLKEAGFWIWGLSERGRQTVAEIAASAGPGGARIALVLGAEGDGLRRLTEETCDGLVRLPTSAAMPSLNVSNAAAVALYELARGR